MNNKLQKGIKIAMLLWAFQVNLAVAQCNVASGTSGVVNDISNTTTINYTVALTGDAIFYNLGPFTACGISFPNITAPWSNNTNGLGTATYSFSIPIYSINVIIGYVGVTGQIQPESFTITTNGSLPTLTVDAGTCAAWTILGNDITSPSVAGGMNAIVNVTSSSPFTTLSITSGANSSSTGGSSYGLCNATIFTSLHEPDSNPTEITIYPNPNRGKFKIDINNKSKGNLNLEIYSSLGQKIFEQNNLNSKTTNEMNFTEIPSGIYFAKLYDGEKIYTKKIIIE